jgi:hypothetical protein
MNTPLIARLATALVLATGLAAGPLTPAPAQTPPAAVVAKPKLPDRCWPSYKHDLQRLQRRMDVQAPHYESHYQSVAAQLDSMVDVLSSGATEVLPQMEAGVAQYRDILSPIIADDRDSAMRLVKSVEKANKNCFRGARQSTFLSGMQSVRAANRDLFRAYEKVQLAALHLTTAQTAKAQEALNDAQLEAVTVEDQFDRGMKRLRSLR